MVEAQVHWDDEMRFTGRATSGHSIVVDGDKKAGNSPMELVLIGLCGCTAYDVVSILRKKREPVTGVEVHASAERRRRRPCIPKSSSSTVSPETFPAKPSKTPSGYRKRNIVRSQPC